MKSALITGASRGIGRACAAMLANDGYKVFFNYFHSEKEALATAAEIGGIPVKADVSDEQQVKAMLNATGNIDVLVCNAGIAKQALLTDMTFDEWRKIFAVNIDGVFNCCKFALPGMIHEKHGKIITVSSMWGLVGASCEVAYSASKAAVIGFTKALAKEVGPSGIRVNCVAPGVINTEMNSELSIDVMRTLKDETPLGYIGSPDDIASLVSFLASDKADFITGQVISSNGGYII